MEERGDAAEEFFEASKGSWREKARHTEKNAGMFQGVIKRRFCKKKYAVGIFFLRSGIV